MRLIPMLSLAFIFFASGCGGDATKTHNDNLPPVNPNTPRISPAGAEKGGTSTKEAIPKVIQ